MKSTACRMAAGIFAALLVHGNAWAQLLSAPSRTQCKQWDDAYIGAFQMALVACAVATLVLALLSGLVGRRFWPAAAPRLRIFIVAFLVLLSVWTGIVALPWVAGFGLLWFSAIDTAYFNCIPLSFGAQGFLAGLIGPGVAAVAQWPTMTYLLLIPTVVAALLAWLISEFVARSFGLRKRAHKEGA
jgi:hypothetical protein